MSRLGVAVAFALMLIGGWAFFAGDAPPAGAASAEMPVSTEMPASTDNPDKPDAAMGATGDYSKATFGGGCFWCMEPPYDKLPGVISTISGYAGGPEKNPTYKQVSSGRTGHTEVVQVLYDPAVVSYDRLLEVFWRNIDPTAENRQFCDGGPQYRTAIYAADDEQLALAKASFEKLKASGRFKQIYTEVEPLDTFYAAEEYHQDFYKKNPDHYYRYRRGCRRDERLEKLWGDEAGG